MRKLKIVKYKTHLVLLFVLGLAAFLRLYDLEERTVFHGELGHVYLELKDVLSRGEIPLFGPATSHPWLRFGPLYYWILIPIFYIYNFDPFSASAFMALVGIAIVWLNYWTISRFFSKKTGLISSYLIAISPLFLDLARGSMLFALVPLFFYPFLYFLVKAIKKDGKYLFWSGLSLGAMLNFHFTPILLIPAVLTLAYYFRDRLKKPDLMRGLVGVMIPNIPLAIYDAKQGFGMTSKLLLWIPYRVAGFLGLFPKNNVSPEVIQTNTNSLFRFLAEGLIKNNEILSTITVFALIIVFILFAKLLYKKRKKSITGLVLMSFFVWGYVGIFVHGNPPGHYYLPLYSIPIIIFSYYIDRYFNKKTWILSIAVLIILSTNNLAKLADEIFNFPRDKVVNGNVPYVVQNQIAGFIHTDSGNKNIELRRVGVLDQYESDFATHYQYILWLYGNEPVKVGDAVTGDNKYIPEVKYTIYENTNDLPVETGGVVTWVKDVAVLREDLD